MSKKIVSLLAAVGATLLLLWALSNPLGPAPPLGPLLNPGTGIWANAAGREQPQAIDLPRESLREPVSIYYDSLRIPHIFASTTHDLYFAQGFATARDRLWQMELQTYAAGGRLSEILGNRTRAYDRYQRRIGMPYAAEIARDAMLEDPETAAAVRAFTDGVNAWINQLDDARLPAEYKILNHRPEPWTPLKTALLLKYMTYMLAGNNGDVRMTNTRAYFGDAFIRNVLDAKTPLMQPTIPAGTTWNFDPKNVQQPDTAFIPSTVADVLPFQPNPANGSNNWAVHGSKTASGYPILANDPHLGLTLPSIWYAMQLHGPDQNVMGATLPGAPGVIIGFNEKVAWGTTNVGADVWDWYEITFRDSTLAEYRYDDEWRPTRQRIERIKIKGEATLIDTLIFTHHGPVTQTFGGAPMRSNVPKYHAMRWIGYEPSNELKYFTEMSRAANYDDYRQALRTFKSPAQNWVFADSSDIAITVTGQYPAKWPEQGRYISDGSDPRYDWQDWVPFEQIPSIRNPDRGFVSSANQDPTDGSYPYYLDSEFAPFERGRRINDRLEALQNITPQDMQQLQLDTYSYHAATALPLMIQYLHTDTLSGNHQQAFETLRSWNLHNDRAHIAPSLFAYWWDALDDAIWDDEYQSTDLPLEWPARDITVHLLETNQLGSWVDDISTPEKETLADLATQSFAQAIRTLGEEFGTDMDGWEWGVVNATNIYHVGQIPGLGQTGLFTDGAGESVNTTRGTHGPSWRMVVALGPEVQAWAVYPGGQSGSPASRYYDNMVDDWVQGRLHPLWFMRQRPAASDSIAYSITLN